MKKHICSILLYSLLLSPTIHSHESRMTEDISTHENHIEDLSIEPIPIIKGFVKGTFYSFIAPMLVLATCTLQADKETETTQNYDSTSVDFVSFMAYPTSAICAILTTLGSAYLTYDIKASREKLKNLPLDDPEWQKYIAKYQESVRRKRINELAGESKLSEETLKKINPKLAKPSKEDKENGQKEALEKMGSASFNEQFAFFVGTATGSIAQTILIHWCKK